MKQLTNCLLIIDTFPASGVVTWQLRQVYSLYNKFSLHVYRSVVFNYRGCGDTGLSTPLLYCPGNVGDLMETICHIKQRYPKSPLMAVGTSLGGYVLNGTSYVKPIL